LPPGRTQAGSEPGADRVRRYDGDNRGRGSGIFRGDCLPISRHDDDVDFALYEISDEFADHLVVAGSKPSFEDDVVAFAVSEPIQLLQERTKDNGVAGIGSDRNKTDTREWGSLPRACGMCYRCAGEGRTAP
jgi:hypothetical protein